MDKKVRVHISTKNVYGEYKTKSQQFDSVDHFHRYMDRLFKAGTKVIGIFDATMRIADWDWETFFDTDPDYISDETWSNAGLVVLNSEYPLDFIRHIRERDLFMAEEIYRDMNHKKEDDGHIGKE